MAEDRTGQNAVGGKAVDLAGDSPELIAFALLRYLAQLEQQNDDIVFDRVWMLDAYAECLEAAQGKRAKAVVAEDARLSTRSRKR